MNDSGQMEDRGGGGGGGVIAFPELQPASGWTQLKIGNFWGGHDHDLQKKC